jgi:hypothetical protein
VSTLSREARAIVAAGKSELVPTQVDRSRVTLLLSKQIGAAGLVLSAPAKAAPALATGKVRRILTIVGTLGVVGTLTGMAYFSRNGAHVPVAPNAVQPSPTQQYSGVPEQEARQTVSPPAAEATSTDPVKIEPPGRTAKASHDSLGEEVQILSRAERELHNGRPALALKALDEHQRRFGSGALAQERSAARIQALCALGRTAEAKAESVKLMRSSPNSPQAAQAKLPCDTN